MIYFSGIEDFFDRFTTPKPIMSKISTNEEKKIPPSILVVGTFQVAVGLLAILSMSISGNWSLFATLLAVAYTALGAGLLAIMEWARFIGVVIHALLLPFLLWQALALDEAGLIKALQVLISIAIFYVLTRPHIRAKFRRQPYPASSS
jgi:uncharacterized membrane protein (DUF2068 family)